MLTYLLPNWTIIGLLAVVLGVAGSFFDKYLLKRYFDGKGSGEGPGALLIFSSLFSVFFTLLILVLKYETIDFLFTTGLVGLGIGFLSGVWILLYLYALNRTEVSRVVPLLQLVPIFALVLGYFFLSEVLTYQQIIAAGTIVFAALILLYNKEGSVFKIDVTTLALMIAVSILIAIIGVLFKLVALETSYWTAVFFESAGLGIFGLFLFVFFKGYRAEFCNMVATRARHVLSANSFNEVLDTTAEFTLFFAVTIGPVALVHSLNAFQPALVLASGAVLAYLVPTYFYDENKSISTTQKIAGVGLMTVGSIYLYTLI